MAQAIARYNEQSLEYASTPYFQHTYLVKYCSDKYPIILANKDPEHQRKSLNLPYDKKNSQVYLRQLIHLFS